MSMFKKRKAPQKQGKITLSDNQGEQKRPEPISIKPTSYLPKPVLSSSTAPHKQRLQNSVKESFDELNYKASNTIIYNDDAAVLENLIDTDKNQDARAKYLRNLQLTKKIKEGELDPKAYRGQSGYANYNANQEVATNSKHKSNFGPIRAPTNIRVSCRFDYNPELCKDWFEAGYCVFGNSCLYLHDRTDYKTGWELQKDFEQQQRERWKRINDPDYQQQFEFKEQLEKQAVQQDCHLCKQKLKQPVSIDCGHILCQKCAIRLNTTKKKCPVCGAKPSGIMNNAEQILEKSRVSYEKLKKELEEKAEANKNKRKRFKNQDSQRVFE